jgi:hypothetical protein
MQEVLTCQEQQEQQNRGPKEQEQESMKQPALPPFFTSQIQGHYLVTSHSSFSLPHYLISSSNC